MNQRSKLNSNERGVIHHLMLFLITGFVVAAVGFAGWRVWKNGQDTYAKAESSDATLAPIVSDDAPKSKISTSADSLSGSKGIGQYIGARKWIGMAKVSFDESISVDFRPSTTLRSDDQNYHYNTTMTIGQKGTTDYTIIGFGFDKKNYYYTKKDIYKGPTFFGFASNADLVSKTSASTTVMTVNENTDYEGKALAAQYAWKDGTEYTGKVFKEKDDNKADKYSVWGVSITNKTTGDTFKLGKFYMPKKYNVIAWPVTYAIRYEGQMTSCKDIQSMKIAYINMTGKDAGKEAQKFTGTKEQHRGDQFSCPNLDWINETKNGYEVGIR